MPNSRVDLKGSILYTSVLSLTVKLGEDAYYIIRRDVLLFIGIVTANNVIAPLYADYSVHRVMIVRTSVQNDVIFFEGS